MGMGMGKLPLLATQDRYILSGLTRELHSTLSAHLTASERVLTHHDARAVLENVTSYTNDDALRPLAHIDVVSRLFRVAGSDAIFIIPGHGVSEAGKVTREVEGKPVVQSLVRAAWRGRRSVRERGELGRARRAEERVGELEGVVEGLRGEVGEGRLGDLVGRERAVGEKALEVQRREERVRRWEDGVRRGGGGGGSGGEERLKRR
ncbi:MAG: hypothetical protein M1835_003999 [Candelina submexicana]|nr:MAG: hypothetical protein M1835_003999 [Candelina submexicana]